MANALKYKEELAGRLKTLIASKEIPEKAVPIIEGFFENYLAAAKTGAASLEKARDLFFVFLQRMQELTKNPYLFEPYHKQVEIPFDYHRFGMDFMRILIHEDSYIRGKEHLSKIASYLQAGENVVLLANHQSEADPFAIGILLQPLYPDLAKKMIFVAGERVITDPLAIPFSMGCNLLCIYSKRYIDFPPEDKLKKQLHNKKTMEMMSALFNAGSKCIYVAPSGGRDRKNKQGKIEVADFDPQSVEMFYLMAKKSEKKTHFFPLALNTYDMLPPPEMVQVELGEERSAKHAKIAISFCHEIDMEKIVQGVHMDKHALRKVRADFIGTLVKNEFEFLRGNP